MSLTPLNDTMASMPDYSKRWFGGRVTSVSDPQGLGRVQVEIPGLLEEGELPWIGVMRNSPFGIGAGFGFYGVPQVGSMAIVEFQDGDLNFGVCIGFFVVLADRNPDFSDPNKWGFADPSGNKLIVDMQAKTWTFTHSSGTEMKINADGSWDVTAVGDVRIRAPRIYLN